MSFGFLFAYPALNEEFFVNLYPNPTPDINTIESNEDIIGWEITDNTGKTLQTAKINNLKKFEVDFLIWIPGFILSGFT